MRTPEPAGLG